MAAGHLEPEGVGGIITRRLGGVITRSLREVSSPSGGGASAGARASIPDLRPKH